MHTFFLCKLNKWNMASHNLISEKKVFIQENSIEIKVNDEQVTMAEKKRHRDEWDRPVEFLFSCLSLSVGLGNIWRFPFTAYQNGGGCFLIPYLIVLFFIGKPIYFMELAWGQFSSYGQVKAWKAVPLLKGVGYGELIASICGGSYYCAIMAICLLYLFNSFRAVLPWTYCHIATNNTHLSNVTHCNSSDESLPELYFKNEVVKEMDNIDNGLGLPDVQLSCCLLAVWGLIFLTLIRGIKSSGKVSYFTALFPYAVLLTLLIRGLTLPGSWNGIRYFIEPQWESILDLKVWYAAVTQCFFSLGTGFGAILMNASFNSFSHNVHRDAMIISLMDTFTSLLAGFTIFATLGNLSYELNVDISEVTKSGPGLAFMSYPEAIAKFPFAPQLFAVLFFMMLLTLGIGTSTAMTNGIVTVVCDQFPSFSRLIVTSAVCSCMFSLGLMYVTPGGQFMITLVDNFGAGFVIYIMVTLEVIGIAWIYGLSNFCHDVEFMLKVKIGWYWRLCWGFIVPISLISIFVYTFINYSTLTHNGHDFPTVALACGWILTGIALSSVPICALEVLMRKKGRSLYTRFLSAIQPSKDWGPLDPSIRSEWARYKLEGNN